MVADIPLIKINHTVFRSFVTWFFAAGYYANYLLLCIETAQDALMLRRYLVDDTLANFDCLAETIN